MTMRHDKSVSIPNSYLTVDVGSLPFTLHPDCRGLIADVDGTVSVTMQNGDAATNLPVLGGVIIPGRFASVTAVGTLTALWQVI